MPCITEPPNVSESQWLEHMLCQACRFLTKEQIMKIDGLDIYQGLWEWYKFHLMDDVHHYIKNIETAHATSRETVLSFPDRDYANKQIERCHAEASRLGLRIVIDDGSISIE